MSKVNLKSDEVINFDDIIDTTAIWVDPESDPSIDGDDTIIFDDSLGGSSSGSIDTTISYHSIDDIEKENLENNTRKRKISFDDSERLLKQHKDSYIPVDLVGPKPNTNNWDDNAKKPFVWKRN